MPVGLGTGSTVAELVPALGRLGSAITCVATSPATAELAATHGLDVRPFSDIAAPATWPSTGPTRWIRPAGWSRAGEALTTSG